MSEELLQRDLIANPEKIGKWNFYNIGSTTVKTLKEHGIVRSVDYGKIESKKPDALLVHKKNVIAVIEYKKPAKFNTKAKQKKAIKQELEVAQKLNANIFIASDKQKTIWINPLTKNRIKDEQGKELITNFNPKDEKLPNLIEKIIASINEKNDQIKPKELVNPTDLAKQIWQDIWSVSGATPENCLYTFVELFIFKYLSDLGVLHGMFSFYYLCDNFDKNTADELLETYANSIRPKIKMLFKENPKDHTTIINGTIFVTKDQKAVKGYSTVFKKILTKFKDYGKLKHIDYDFKSQLFESFLKESISKKNWGQFFTPLKVVRAIVEMAKDEVKEGVKICDPACGVGKFLLEPIITQLDRFYEIKKGKLTPKIYLTGFDKGFDKDEQKTIILAKANMLIYFSNLIKDNPNITTEFSNLFNDSFLLKTNSILGTLSEPATDEYDLILTNPPYVTSGSSNLKEEIKKDGDLVNYFKVNAMGVEGLFMEWIIRALKPNGKAFIVVPDGIFNRQNDKNLRQFIIDECFIDSIISLPEKTFFTTPKKTYILCITKKTDKKEIQKAPVFTYLVSEIGESRDVYRFNIEQDDLSEAVVLYNGFKGSKDYFIKTNTDKRCKIQPIAKFDPETHWSIERWWTKEEKIALEIIEEDKTLDINAFSELIIDASETLKEYSDLLKGVAEKKKLVSEFREIGLSDNNYFRLFIGKRLVKRDLIHINGNMPIYSANAKTPISYHNQSNISDFSNNFVLWGIDGDFEFNFIPKNTPFVTTDHCGAIRILTDDILPEYLMLQLDKVKHKYGFDRGLRSSLKNMQEIFIEIPFDENGKVDIEKQKEVADKYEYIVELRKKIAEYKKQIEELNVEIEQSEIDKANFKIDDLFDIKSGNSKLTQGYVNANKGEYVVYSANTKQKGIFGYINSYDYNVECIQLTTNGVYAGTFFYREKHKFSINGDAKLLIKKDEDLDYYYLLNELKSAFIAYKFNWENKPTIEKIKPIEIPIPVTPEGRFNLSAQKEIAEKYRKIEQIKKNISEELDKIAKIEIDFE
jgi:type I restriction-modification system DNA methylase subunit